MMLLGVAEATQYTRTTLPSLTMDLSFGLQPTSFLGFYDTMFTASVTVKITNVGAEDFPGGNLTGLIYPPSGSWGVPIFAPVPVIRPYSFYVIVVPFRPQEAGVYTLTILGIDTAEFGRILPSDMASTGTITQVFQGPGAFFGSAVGIAFLLAIGLAFVQDFARKRVSGRPDTLDKRLNKAARSLASTMQSVSKIQQELKALQPAMARLEKESLEAKRVKLDKTQRDAIRYLLRGELRRERLIVFMITFIVAATFFFLAIIWPAFTR